MRRMYSKSQIEKIIDEHGGTKFYKHVLTFQGRNSSNGQYDGLYYYAEYIDNYPYEYLSLESFNAQNPHAVITGHCICSGPPGNIIYLSKLYSSAETWYGAAITWDGTLVGKYVDANDTLRDTVTEL